MKSYNFDAAGVPFTLTATDFYHTEFGDIVFTASLIERDDPDAFEHKNIILVAQTNTPHSYTFDVDNYEWVFDYSGNECLSELWSAIEADLPEAKWEEIRRYVAMECKPLLDEMAKWCDEYDKENNVEALLRQLEEERKEEERIFHSWGESSPTDDN